MAKGNHPQLEVLNINDLALDLENPRFNHLRRAGKLTEAIIEEEILERDDDTPNLSRSIQKSGVKDPIWVIKKGPRYVVIEGNRRVVVLREIIRQKEKAPPGVSYDEVPANIMKEDTPDVEVLLQKARLQTGKKAWGAYNEAALTYQLQERPFLMHVADIAAHLKISESKVKQRLADYKLFNEYVKVTKDDNPKRFSLFQECPPKVREWFEESSKNKSDYFRLISPASGKFHKIRSVATRGGLRDFQTVLEDPEILKRLLTDPNLSVEDAVDEIKAKDPRSMPFLKKIMPLAMGLRTLDNERIEKLKKDPRFKTEIKSLASICNEIVKKLEK